MISDEVQKVITNYVSRSVEIVDSKYQFNQYDTIRRIYLYVNDEFWNNVPEDTIFWNISTPRIPHFAKNIDLDTKNLAPIGVGSLSMVQSFILKTKFKKWVRDNNLAIQLNDMSDSLATFASTVVKVNRKTKEVEECDLRNLYFNPTVKSIRDANIVEKHYLNETELRAKKDVWDNVEKVIDKGIDDDPKKDSVRNFEIWEYSGEVEVEGDMVYKHIIGSGEGDDEVILFEEELKREDCLYYDFHASKYKGRWLRVGVVERLFKLQAQTNSVVNQNAEARTIASLLLLQTSNPDIEGNVLKQAESGDIINDDTLKQVGLDNRAFNVLLGELQQIEMKADKLCMTPDVVTGEKLPSGTTFRGQAQLTNAAKSAFKDAQDRLGAQLEVLLRNEILPQIKKDFRKEEIIEIAGNEEDIEQFDKLIFNRKVKRMLERFKAGELKIDSEEELAKKISEIQRQVTEELEQNGRKVRLEKDWLDIEWDIKFNITNESEDKEQTNNAYFNAIQFMISNPNLINTPIMKQYLENNGISWWRVKPSRVQELQGQQGQQQGGQQAPEPKQPDKLMSLINK
jgi:hypothetical protein